MPPPRLWKTMRCELKHNGILCELYTVFILRSKVPRKHDYNQGPCQEIGHVYNHPATSMRVFVSICSNGDIAFHLVLSPRNASMRLPRVLFASKKIARYACTAKHCGPLSNSVVLIRRSHISIVTALRQNTCTS